MNTCEKLTLVNSFYAIVSDSGKLYSVEMNWENACKMANFYNSTIKGEGKISVKLAVNRSRSIEVRQTSFSQPLMVAAWCLSDCEEISHVCCLALEWQLCGTGVTLRRYPMSKGEGEAPARW